MASDGTVCDCTRIISISAKCSDCFSASCGEKELQGYVPRNLQIGDGDYVEFKYCADCGQIQGRFPLSKNILVQS